MISRLFIDKKNLYMFLSMLLLIISIALFNIFNYKHSRDALTYKEKTEDASMTILISISKEINLDKSFIKNVLK